MILSLILSFALTTLAFPYIKRQSAPSGVPSYVLTYAPIVYLFSGDPYRPSDIGTQLVHTQPELNYTLITNAPNPLTLDNLNALNSLGGNFTYLTSRDNVTANPSWLHGVTPSSSGKTEGATSAAIIVNDHGNGLVDAFYFYFYAFNQGGWYFGLQIGDHVGDWEHNMIRFKNGVPQAIWYSQHENGEAFEYSVVQKQGVRPVVYSANGTHANYATPGTHDHTIPDVNLPKGPLEDHTNAGPLWDPTLSAYYYTYNAATQKFATYSNDSSTPVNWLYYEGAWGDKQYPNSNPQQTTIFGIKGTQKYVDGPTGPEDKDLNRTKVCPDDGILCIVRPILGP